MKCIRDSFKQFKDRNNIMHVWNLVFFTFVSILKWNIIQKAHIFLKNIIISQTFQKCLPQRTKLYSQTTKRQPKIKSHWTLAFWDQEQWCTATNKNKKTNNTFATWPFSWKKLYNRTEHWFFLFFLIFILVCSQFSFGKIETESSIKWIKFSFLVMDNI